HGAINGVLLGLHVAAALVDVQLAPDVAVVLDREQQLVGIHDAHRAVHLDVARVQDRKSTRLNSSHVSISYAVFCLKKKNNTTNKSRSNTASNSTTHKSPHLSGLIQIISLITLINDPTTQHILTDTLDKTIKPTTT